MQFDGLTRVISGAQTGVDRAAIDAAISMLAYSWGGCVPRGRTAEDGEIPDRYFSPSRRSCGLVEHEKSREHKARTVANIKDSDATMILRIHGGGRVLGPGTKLTIKTLQALKRPYRLFDPSRVGTVPKAARWICETPIGDGDGRRQIEILNVAGTRESRCPGIYEQSRLFLRDVFSYVFIYQQWGIRIWSPKKPQGKTQ